MTDPPYNSDFDYARRCLRDLEHALDSAQRQAKEYREWSIELAEKLAKAKRIIEGSPVLSATRTVAEALEVLASALRVEQAREDTRVAGEDEGLVRGENERALLVETAYGRLPVGTRFQVYAHAEPWILGADAWSRRSGGYPYQAVLKFGRGEIISPLAHDRLGYPLYEGDRVEWTEPGLVTGSITIQSGGEPGLCWFDDGTGCWLVRFPQDCHHVRKIHDGDSS